MYYSLEPSPNFPLYESFEPLSSTLRGDRHMPLGTFLYKIQCRTIQFLFEGFLAAMRIFGSVINVIFQP